ncbi:ExbD/TolR family protein [Flavobacterium procerum]|uniref:ExbD/TolR family protein n=1 Tax=Flavobacterium procerum TaxID=1455569 RepID=A0ABV6BV10_9FLAO
MQNLPKKIRSRKLNSIVDLTAMVSVSFLLIIFFMVAAELRKPKVMDLSLPTPSSEEFDCVLHCYPTGANRTITVLLDDKDKIITYFGNLYTLIENPKKIDYGKDGIRKELFQKNKSIREYSAAIGRPKSGAIVIIKPSKKSNFKNLVDILDEMAIAGIDTYAIVNDFSIEEEKLLASN